MNANYSKEEFNIPAYPFSSVFQPAGIAIHPKE